MHEFSRKCLECLVVKHDLSLAGLQSLYIVNPLILIACHPPFNGLLKLLLLKLHIVLAFKYLS